MSDSVKVIGAEKIIATVQGIARDAITPDMLRSIGLLAVRSVQRGIRDQKEPDGSPYAAVTRFGQGGQRMIDTARLLNSITFEVRGQSVAVGTNVDYAPAQHFGGTWGAKSAQKLAIPLTRRVARAYVAGKSLRDQYPGAFVLKARTGNLFLARRVEGSYFGLPLKSINEATGKRSRARAVVELLYMLVDSTTIKGTHFLGISNDGEHDIRVYLDAAIQKRIDAGGNA